MEKSSFSKIFFALLLLVVYVVANGLTVDAGAFKAATKVTHIYPSNVQGTGWGHLENLRSREVTENGIFQSFSSSNSAVLGQITEVPTSSVEVPSVTPLPEVVPEVIQEAGVPTTSLEIIAPDSILETIQSEEPVGIQPVDELLQNEEPAAGSEEVPVAPEAPADETVSFFNISNIIKPVAGLYAFAQLVFTEPVIESVAEPVEEDAPVVVEESEMIPKESVLDDVVADTPTIAPENSVNVPIVDTIEIATGTDAFPQVDVTPETVAEPGVVASLQSFENSIILSDFGISNLESGEFIKNLQLRVSLAGQATVEASALLPFLSVEYSFGQFSGEAGSILIDEEVSNALNGGYYLVSLPSIANPELLADLSIKISFNGALTDMSSLYIDSAWLELETVVYDKQLLKDRTLPKMLTHLEGLESMEFLSNELDFTREELPHFSLRYNSQRNILVQAFRSLFVQDFAKVEHVAFIRNRYEETSVTPTVSMTPEGIINIALTKKDTEVLKPGTYTVEIDVAEGGVVTRDSFEFQWGLLTINTNQTEYGPDESVSVSMGALTPNGNTICNANLNLYITDPTGFISNVPVAQSGQCFGNNVIDVPDYSTQFVTEAFGEYEMYLERVDDNGDVLSHTSETFFVVANQEIVIEREGPTRIFPPAPYVVELSVHTLTRSFTGELVERVPDGFEIFNTDAEIRQGPGYTELVWDISMLSEKTETVSYEFDAPDISPYLFNLGPAKLVSTEDVVTTEIVETVLPSNQLSSTSSTSTAVVIEEITTTTATEVIVFEEHRQWQIASDALVPGVPNLSDTPSFDNVMSTTTTPTIGGFASIDPDPNDVSYDFQIDDSYDFSSPATTTSSLNYPGDAGWSAATFTSGATTTYTIQPDDALIDGVTYWWRVRATDADGTTNYTTPRSITIDTSLARKQWFQTLGLQFERGTLLNLSTSTGAVELATGVGAVPVVEPGFTSNTAVPGATLTLTKPSGVEVDDLLLVIVGNDAANSGAQWSGATLAAEGFSLINEAGDNTSDAHAAVFWKVADGTEGASVNVGAAASNDYWGYYLRVTGADPVAPINVTGADYNGGSTASHPITAITTTGANTLAFYVLAGDGGDVAPFGISGTGWSEGSEITAGTGFGNAAGVWGTRAMATAGTTGAATVSMSSSDGASGFQFSLKPAPVTSGTIMSPEVDFDWVPVENDWGDVSWNVTEPVGTDTFARVYYTSATACDTIVPDIDLPGNSAGFDAAATGVVISTLATSTYNRICLQMTLDLGAGASSPTLDSWTVNWDLPNQTPDVPTLIATPAFDSLLATTTPLLGGFVTSDFEGESFEYELLVDDSYDFSSPVLTKLSSDYPTDTGWSAALFTSGATTTYAIQPADALINGTTYYWRVRARDPLGSNTWSEYSERWSVTIDSTLEKEGWYQTLGLQFDTGVLSNLSTTTGGVELTTLGGAGAVTVDSFEGTTDSSGDFASTALWKQASITTDAGDWWGTTGGTASNNTGPDTASDGTFAIYTEASAGQPCANNAAPGTDCAIEADIADGTLDGIHFDYHMFGTSIETLNLDVYNGVSWTNVWTRTGQQSVSTLDWKDSGYLDLSAYKADTTALRFYALGTGAGFGNDIALDNIRVSTSSLSSGTIMSPEVDFDWVAGETDWGVIEWGASEPAGTFTRLRAYYTSATACDTIIPDIDLPGNSLGFGADQSGVFINSLSTTTYSRICLQMTLNQGSGVVSPTLDNWTIKWIVPNQAPAAPLLTDLPAFDNERSTTTTPTLGGFVTSDYESEVMEYEVTVDADYSFSSPDLTKISSNYPADAGWSAATFGSGATTSYTIQPADALSNGVTYWWRVRARDPLGSNTWSEYSVARSMTISNSVSVPEWYQTTGSQFETNTLLVNTATTTDGITIDSSAVSVSLIDPWAVGSSHIISEGVDRVLVVGIISEDSATGVDVNTVTYGGQLLTQVDDQQIGTGFSNGLWLGYLNEAGIAAAVGTNIVPTWTGGTPDNGILYTSAVFGNVNQDFPVRDNSGQVLTSGSLITPAAAIDVVAGDMMVYVTESATGLTHTPATGYTEGTEEDIGGSGFSAASAYKSITSDGSEYPEATWSASGNRVIMAALDLQPSPSQAVILSTEVDFNWVENQTDWGEVIWHVTEPAGSDSLLQVYYSNVAACDTLVSDIDLPGNGAGFVAGGSPVDISSLSTTTFNRICLRVTLSKGTAASLPTLLDWGVSWELSSVLEQTGFWWFANADTNTPTDTWPVGATGAELLENQAITSEYPTKTGDVLQLRMGVGVSSVNASSNAFKLQFAESLTCDASLQWTDVAPAASSTALWRGYNNPTVSDGSTLPSALLSLTDILETYEEENNSAVLPNIITAGQFGEWDWVLQNNADAGTSYCFRMVNTDGSTFKTYTNYPKLVTNQAPSIVSIDAPFDNEKLQDTTPFFDFTAVDPEGEEVDYQIQIDDDGDFSSTVIDANSISNFTAFANLDTFSDKSPFNDGETIRYTPTTALTNGVTYWWRVRAKDTNASTRYGEWETPRSFTVDTAVTLTTWFQTTQEQFDTNAHIGTESTAADLITFASGSTIGTTTSTAIDFDDVTVGNAWGEFSFNETGAASDILYHIEYLNGLNWELVPDGSLAGNAVGFDTSPVDLIDLDTETYNQIRIRANFENGTPTMTDWTVTWGLRVSVPTHLLLFDNEKTDTTTPTFTFFTTDPQGDDLEYEFSWSTDVTFASGSTTVTSSISPDFLNIVNGADGDPFTSGDTISYTMSSALTNGVTYWWRVRAKDPIGGDSFSFWSDPWSFTVDTTATTSTWYQTTQEQFNTDTLVSLVASGADSVSTVPAAVTTYNFAGVTNPSAGHVARYFEVDVDDPTDPPTVDAIDTLTILGTSASTPNLRTAIASYTNDVEATNGQYTALASSDNNRWTTLDPGAGDNAVFWTEFIISENPANVSQLDLLLEGYQGGAPAGTDKGWFGIWRPGASTPYWQNLSASQQTGDANYTAVITTNIAEYFDGANKVHLVYFNEDDSDPVVVDYVEIVVTSETATEGTITSAPLDFDDGSGPAWGQMLWTDAEPGLSNIDYQIEYLNGVGVWELIPDAALSGNAAGFSTAPVDLKFLNTTTYNEIRAVGNFLCSGANCPTLDDWTIEWSRGFTVSGTAYEYDGVTPVTGGTVAVAINGVLQVGKTATISAGTWTIDNVTYFTGDVVTVFVTGAADADEAVGVTVYDGVPDITNMRLQKRHLSLGSADTAVVTNAHIGTYDFTNDEDLFFNVDGGNDLTLCVDVSCDDAGLVILASSTYTPASGSDLVTHDLQNNGILTLTNNILRVSGSWDNNATSSMGASTVIMTATSTTETIDANGAVAPKFYNLVLGEIAGTATWDLVSPLSVDGDLTVSYGTLNRSAQPIAIFDELTTGANGFWSGIATTTFNGSEVSVWLDQNATLQNIGHVEVNGSSHFLLLGSDVVAESVTIAAGNTLDLSSGVRTLTVHTHWVNNGTLQAQNGAVTFDATTAGNTITNTTGSFYDITFAGVGGAWAFTESTLGVNNNFTIATGTVTMPTATTTLAGSFINSGGTFVHNNSVIKFTSTGSETISALGTAFTNAFYNLVFSGSGNWTMVDANATTSNDILKTSGTLTLPTGTLTVGGSFQNTGGVLTANAGTLELNSGASVIIALSTSPLFNLLTTGTGTYTMTNTNATIAGDVIVTNGTLVLPSGTLSLGGSLANGSVISPLTGTVLFNSVDVGKTINLGASSLYNATFDSSLGGWTIVGNATTTSNTTLNAGLFAVNPGITLSVGNVFTNTIGGASTTWTGSILSLENGAYTINPKTSTGDTYQTLRLSPAADVSLWNSSAVTVLVSPGGSLYSQDHAGVDGSLAIYGQYTRNSGTEYWSYATDFDGTVLGTTSRQVAVQFDDGASLDIEGVGFNMIGSPTASTTVSNQGSGTYVVNVHSGTVAANYYDLSNLGMTGLSLLGTTTVTSLDDGSFAVAASGGSALTVASTTIDANVAKQIYRVTFATTTAIAAYNVSQSDGTPTSYWWFRESLGNIDGEANDNDTGDPGSVRWDDSSLTITVAGTVFTDAGVTPLIGGTCDGVTNVVRVVIENGAVYDGNCSPVDGSYSIPGVVVVGDPTMTVFLNNAPGGEFATMVTKTPTSDVINAHLYANRVIIRNEDVNPMTIAALSVYDSSDDADIRFTAATGTIDTLLTAAQTELFVWATSTFTPGGDIEIASGSSVNTYDGSLYIDSGATFVAAGTSTYSIGGIFTQGPGATFVPASSTVLFTATTTGKAVTAAGGETIAFNEVQFIGSGGAWNINADISLTADLLVSTGTVTGTGDITLTNGSFYGNGLVSLGGGTVLLEKTNTLGGVQAWTVNNLTLGTGLITGTTTPASTATSTVAGVFTIATGHTFDAGTSGLELSGSGTVFVENGTFAEGAGTVRYSGVAATSILATNYHNLDLTAGAGAPTYTATGIGISVANNLLVGGMAPTVADFDTNDTVLNVDGAVTIATNGTFVGSDSALFTVAGDWDNNGMYVASTGTVTFDGTGSQTIAAGVSDFASALIIGTGAYTISEHATATAAFTIASTSAFTLASGQTLAVGGVFTNTVADGATTWTGSTLSLYGGGNYVINDKTRSDLYETIIVGANTDIRSWNSSASTVTTLSGGSLYSMDHANVAGDLYVYGDYEKNTGTDYWSYATDFDGTDLTGGSERQAAVYVASGDSVLYQSGGALAVLGDATASTTIQNQGSGVFGFTIGNTGSTTMSYYTAQDIDSNGLTFAGAPHVTTLSYGSFLVANNADSAITVAGTAITANPALTFTNNTFATTSGVTTAVNVTATGASVSSWRFTNHEGDLAGEAYDVDPDGDPGYIVWDDSAASITISGTVYSNEGSGTSTACDGVTNNITVRVAGLTSYTASCDAVTGAYSVSSVTYSPGDSIVAYINGEIEKAATVTEDPISNISNLDLYENRVIVRHEGSDSLSVADMAVWDSSDDADIPFTAVTGAPDVLTLPSDTKLIVWSGKEFEPVGTVVVSGGGAGAAYDGAVQLFTGALWTANGTEEYSIGGSMILDDGAVFAAANSTTTFTTTGAARTIDVNTASFYNIAFTGSGSWTIIDGTLDVQSLYMTAGTLTLPTGTTTVTGSFVVDGGSFINNGSPMVFDGADTGNQLKGNGSDFAAMQFTGTGEWIMSDMNATSTGSVTIASSSLTLPSGSLTVGGDFLNTGGTVVHNSSEIILSSNIAASVLANGSNLASVRFIGAGPYTFVDGSLSLTENLTIAAGAVTMATGTLSIAGSFDATGGTFDNATGTILFNSSDTGETIHPGVSDFYNVVFGNGSGGWTVTANATTTHNFTLSSASVFTQQSGTTLSVGNVFSNSIGGAATTWTGSTLNLTSGTGYQVNTKTLGGDVYGAVYIAADTDIAMWNSQAATTTVDASGSLYSKDHNAVNGSLYIYGDYHIGTTTEYWNYATDFDGTNLTGGGERAVTVSIAGGATTTVDGGTLNIVGAAGNATTITNQGVGAYTFIANAGTFNALYYAYRNLDVVGLQLLGETVISSLSSGDFELAVDTGSLMNLSSSTLNANASLVITGTRFATTTSISGVNVYLTGSTSNAWTFIGHSGNLSGEDFDVDGVTECGSVRWTDSACLLTQQVHYQWRHDDGGIGVPSSEWYNASWNKRKRVRLENTDASVYTNPVVQMTVAYDSNMQADFSDLRFTSDDGVTEVPFWIEEYTSSVSAVIWVQAPSLPASDFATVFMYYSNVGATSVSSSTQTFITADDFEDGDISEYSGDTALFAVDATYAFGGSYGLDNTGNETAHAVDGIYNTSAIVSQGQIIRYMQYVDTVGGGDEVCTLFAVQSPGSTNNNYAVCTEQVPGTDRFSLSRDVSDVDSSGTILSSSTVTYSTGWYEVEVDWQTSDDMTVTLSKDGSVVTTLSANDSSYSTGGIGFTYWYNSGGWDGYTSRIRLDTEPTVYFGAEQEAGGATWASALDAPASNFSIADTARLRVLVENSGLQVVGHEYQIEYAEQGGAPSCEAVSGGSYAAVPPQVSCGSSPVCMQSSAYVANGDSTTDLLSEARGTFTPGALAANPSNTATALTIEQNEYTELEYVLTPTVNVTDENLCFRVTNAGAEIDTYLRVAALQLKFDPAFGAVSFNGGNPISLLPGTTTRIYASSTVTDLNGYSDITLATSTFYRTGVAGVSACAEDDNNCYRGTEVAGECSFTGCSGNSCDLVCYADIYYYADATDAAPYEGQAWSANLEVEDAAGGYDFGDSPVIELQTLRALGVTNAINYGSLAASSTSGVTNASTTVENLGNVAIDIDIEGTSLDDGYSSTIPASEQIFATSTFDYDACVTCTALATTATSYNVDLSKPTTTVPAITDDVFWGIAIPFGVSSNPHTGGVTFTPINDI